ncbi:MAG: hypothetical protein A2452_03195 [Candidatus Firestonebacteria bacterium RIFOXYC2_FULL_39_67]|nr:MAG: hypothetical protein A2536_02610 [Candidatus Firestonebacteria bacterium RIFOXYD2_FULL_39_29]OGF55274.1 MAG: hypothetical protein A2452_03195 [Candidatus Firestonebacteria bacterium RIFOXYC2_FULL_39_67]
MKRTLVWIGSLIICVSSFAFSEDAGVSNFNNMYEKIDVYNISIGENPYTMEFYALKSNENYRLDTNVVVIKSNDKECFRQSLMSGSLRPLKKLNYVIPKRKEKLLCIQSDLGGGNAWRSRLYYVVSIASENVFKVLGEIDFIKDIDNDGVDELIDINDTFELLLAHYESPSALIIKKIENNCLVDDLDNKYYANRIEEINTENKALYSNNETKENDKKAFRNLVEKLLISKTLKKKEEGWRKFKEEVNVLKHVFSKSETRTINVDEYLDRLEQGIFGEEIKKKEEAEVSRKIKELKNSGDMYGEFSFEKGKNILSIYKKERLITQGTYDGGKLIGVNVKCCV